MSFVDQDADHVENPQPSHLDGVEFPEYVYQVVDPRQLVRFLASLTDVTAVDRPHALGTWALILAMTCHRLGHVSTTRAAFLGHH
jgi:hypothetical protein